MLIKHFSPPSRVLSALLLLSLTACGGSGGSEDDLIDVLPPEPSDGTTIVPAPTPNDGGSELVTLDSLGPLIERLYPESPVRQVITGPVVGSGLLTNSEIISEIPFEVDEKMNELEVEAAYLIRSYSTDRNGALELDRPSASLAVVVTNVSNRMVCNVSFNRMDYVFNNGSSYRASADNVYGYASLDAEEFNQNFDRFEYACIPPKMSVYAYGGASFQSVGSNADPIDVDDVAKLTIGRLFGRMEDEIVSFSGIHGTTFVQSADGEYNVTLVNPSSRNLDYRSAVLLFIDPTTGIPISSTGISSVESLDSDVFAPGQEVNYGLTFFSGDDFIGSTNTIIVYPEYTDADAD